FDDIEQIDRFGNDEAKPKHCIGHMRHQCRADAETRDDRFTTPMQQRLPDDHGKIGAGGNDGKHKNCHQGSQFEEIRMHHVSFASGPVRTPPRMANVYIAKSRVKPGSADCAYRSRTRRSGSSRLSLTRTRKVTASLPSTMR